MMRELLEKTTQLAISYLEGLADRNVAPRPEAIANLAKLDEPLSEHPTAPEEVINLLNEVCSPATMAMAGPRFFGFVIGGSLPAALAANWLARSWDQMSGLAEVTPLPAKLEDVALRWLRDVLGLPPETGDPAITSSILLSTTSVIRW